MLLYLICTRNPSYFIIFSANLKFFFLRYAHLGDVAVGHITNAGKRFAAVLLCVFYFWNRRRATVGGITAQPLFPGCRCKNVSTDYVLYSSHTTAIWHLVITLYAFMVLFNVFFSSLDVSKTKHRPSIILISNINNKYTVMIWNSGSSVRVEQKS